MTPSTTAIEGVTEALNRNAVDGRAAGEPSWLLERRVAAWAAYEQTPMPTTRLEEWRYTDLRRLLDLDALRLEAPPAEVPTDLPAAVRETMAEDREATAHVVGIDGRVSVMDLDAEAREAGVVLMSLKDAVAAGGDTAALVEKHLATRALPASEGKFQALNAALWSDGVLLVVPKNVRMEKPVRLTRWMSASGVASFGRTLIVAERGSQVSFVDEVLSDDLDAQSLLSTAVEIIALDNAQVQYVCMQRMGSGAFFLSQQRTLANRDSTLDTLNVNVGASVARVDLNAQLLGPGANSDMLGLYFADANQHFDHSTSQDHVAPNATSDLLYKGALDDSSRAVFRGIIKVHPGAQRTDAYQTNRNLLLSEHATADSLPNLEIEADDVRCSHGATVGQLDAEALFYLMSRGLPRERAERLVVQGFLGEVLGRLPLGGVVDKVYRVIRAKLDAH